LIFEKENEFCDIQKISKINRNKAMLETKGEYVSWKEKFHNPSKS